MVNAIHIHFNTYHQNFNIYINISKIVRISKYLQSPRTTTKIILDTGATQHMTGDMHIFLTLTIQLMFPSNQVVVLVDGSTTLPICGVGAIRLKIGIYILEIENMLYVPRLDDTIFSITEHIKYSNCSFIGNNNKYTLIFPKNLFLQ